MNMDVLLYFELKNNVIPPSVYNLCRLMRMIDPELNINALITSEHAVEQGVLNEYGVSRCYFMKKQQYNYDIAELLHDLAGELRPSIIAGISTPRITSCLSGLAARFQVTPVHACCHLAIDSEEGCFLLDKQILGSKLNCRLRIKMNGKPLLVSFLPNLVTAEKIAAEISFESIVLAESQYRCECVSVISEEKKQNSQLELTESKIIVSGGWGVRKPESLNLLKRLGSRLEAAIGASRALVDAHIVDESYQVGQTGKTINPQLYLAIGISGAPQHITGMRNSRCIIAINKDPDADIFKYAAYGIAGDADKIMSALLAELAAQESAGGEVR